ncbi:hypothetical protein SynBIOSE41_02432 [Synechococcus sp. BIOS-E4-1]|uniref:hypothetical protein n=1 Tax=Synechococcus sp. BIOS-E4-1 TaxID=1400864 RepID=UPI001648AA8E|nr:hypothetical protein [Synechococcus sp. BIOS-E4-1]QNI54931.1 hypothetical protein SynBIOSE41_02432 [Synechococcus sp. BIOS-E4-1]
MNNSFTQDQLVTLIQDLQQQGASAEQIKSLVKQLTGGEPEMTQRDGVTMQRNEPEAPAAYESAYSKLQDFYASSPRGEQTYTNGQQRVPGFYQNLNVPVVPMSNPNSRVEEPRTQTVDDRGNVVIY